MGHNIDSPTRCNNKGVFGEWGEWDVSDKSCAANWGDLQNNGCTAVGVRTFASRLWNVPPGQSWETACQSTPETVAGEHFAAPMRCNNKGAFGEWGEWDVKDGECAAHWGDLQDNGCSAKNTRTFASRIWNIPPGQTWDAACHGTPETIKGQNFISPARCNNKGVFGEWGEWDVSDQACFATCEYILFDPPASATFVGIASTPSGEGYWLLTAKGGVFSFGDAQSFGSAAGPSPTVGIAATPSGNGYWIAGSDGSVSAFGDAPQLGKLSNLSGDRAIVGIASTPSGKGYWLASADGSVAEFGDADKFAHPKSAHNVVAIVRSAAGKGYWEFQADGVSLPFGDANAFGGAGPVDRMSPIVAGAGLREGAGYVLVGSNSITFPKGAIPSFGNCADRTLVYPITSIAVTPSGKGYWELDAHGGVFPYGDAAIARPATQGGQASPRMRGGNSASVLLDGSEIFSEVSKSIISAKKSIEIMQLFFSKDFIAKFGFGAELRLTSLLNEAAARGVKIRILYDKVAQTGMPAGLDDAIGFPGQVSIRGFPIWEPGRLHAKSVIVDQSTAFLLGATFTQDMFDTQDHPVESSMRGGKEPLHTEALMIQGPSVGDVEQHFVEFWNALDAKYFDGKDQMPVAAAVPAVGNATVQVLRTVPPAVGVGPITGEIEILEGYERAFANARRYIYVENQYLLFRPILEAIRSAMDHHPELEVIAVVNENPDQRQFMYREWQAQAIRDVLGPPGPHLGLFSLWTLNKSGSGKPSVRRIYMEGKLAMVDDVWMTLGTANMDGLSQAAYETDDNRAPPALFVPLTPLIEAKRSAEINGAIFDGVDGGQSMRVVRATRCRLWQEHLGNGPGTICGDGPPAGGWLSVWNSVANGNVTALNSAAPLLKGHVLPWVPGGLIEAASQLHALGVNTDSFNVVQDNE